MPFTFALECSLDPITQNGEHLSHVEVQPCLLHVSSVFMFIMVLLGLWNEEMLYLRPVLSEACTVLIIL